MTDLSLIISQIRQRLEILYQEVDRLEAGGGGGDTGDYNDLTNKPKINSVTLSGNKSLADLGIAPASTTYTKTEVDTALSGKANSSDVYAKSETYTKTQTDAEIQGAITDIDVPSTAVTGHYIQSIAQVDGKIAAVAETIDTSVTAYSTHPVTSGAVATALSSKLDTTYVYDLATNIDPAENETLDLDNVGIPNGVYPVGRYRISNSTFASRVLHGPTTASGYELTVRKITSSNYIVQTAFLALDANVPDKYYQRHYRGTGSGAVNGWSPWYVYEGTVVT